MVDLFPVFSIPVQVGEPFNPRYGAARDYTLRRNESAFTAVAIPHFIFYSAELYGRERDLVMQHELAHAQQWEALGPGLAVAYLLTAGHPFEDYIGDRVMWQPPDGMRQCPMFRWRSDDGFNFMPCWHF